MSTRRNGRNPNLFKRRLVIVGPGAIGLTLATVLGSVCRVSLLVRDPHYSVLSRATLRVTGHRTVASPPGLVDIETIESLSPWNEAVDLWLALKAGEIAPALAALAHRLPAESTVAVLSNGLGIYTEVRDILPQSISVLRLLPSFGAYKQSPAETRLAGDLTFAIAGPPSTADHIARTGEFLRSIGATVTTESDVELAEWRKALINLVVNPLCALAGVANGALGTDLRLGALIAPLLQEITAVTAKAGVPLEPITATELINRLSPHASNLNSMLIDLRLGRPTEIEYITGRFLERAQLQSISTPLMRSLYEAVRAVEAGALSRVRISGDLGVS